MTPYDVDAPVNAVADWIRTDRLLDQPRLLLQASKEYAFEADFDRAAFGLGDEDDVTLVSVVGLLEVQTRRGRKDWTLQLRIEESLGLRAAGDEDDYEDQPAMPFEAFDEQFLATGLGEVEMSVLAETPAAKARFDRWLTRHLKRAGP